jgi:hypothetical protein
MLHFAPTTICQAAAAATAKTMTPASKAIESRTPSSSRLAREIKAITKAGTTLLKGYWNEHQGGAQYHDEGADQALGCLERSVPAWMNYLLKISEHR